MSLTPFKLCADDYGVSPAVTAGILEALSARRLTATSAITTRPGWAAAAAAFAPVAGYAEIGLHLNLTLGTPLGAMPIFAPNGLPAVGAVIRAARAGTLPEVEIRAEIARQFDAFEQAMGRAPDFVDGHQHVQVLPNIRLWLLQEMARRGYAGRVWLRDSSDTPLRILARHHQLIKAAAVTFFAYGFARDAAAMGFTTNIGFSGFSAFDESADYGAEFSKALIALGPNHLVMCHPGHVDAELASLDPVLGSREKELAFLLSDRFTQTLQKANACLKFKA